MHCTLVELSRPTLTVCLPQYSGGCAGRHLLAEMVVDTFIPNDTHMSHEAGRVQVTHPCISSVHCSSAQTAWHLLSATSLVSHSKLPCLLVSPSRWSGVLCHTHQTCF